jgi:hypothetical protein
MESFIESVKEQVYDINQHACLVLRNEKIIRNLKNRDVANICGLSEDVCKYILAEKPPKDPKLHPIIRIAMGFELDLNYVFGYTPPQKADTAVVTVRDDNYISELVKAHERHIEDVKAMCELRLADKDAMYERIIAELKG